MAAPARLNGKAALITGGSRGLGLAVAERFAGEGADLAVCAREEGPLREAAVRIEAARAHPDQRFLGLTADVSDPEQVGRLVQRAVDHFGRIDALVCNAGVWGPIGPAETVDWDDWERAVRINLFGPVLACRAVLPIMRRQGGGQIVVLSGGGATQGMPRFSAYAASKAAVVRFVETLAGELAGTGIDANAVAPGALNTRMLDQLLAAGPDLAGQQAYARGLRQREEGGAPLSRAVDLILHLAAGGAAGVSGRLIAALWDDWPTLAERREQLEPTDVYLLRRIVPEDRGWPPS
jgi:3-oxoacyl-[acyl-carrier protein] reductase